jgi:nicotinate-nucleotide pyrophosphorylase (carboxylating)
MSAHTAFSRGELATAQRLVEWALAEDVADTGDVTSQALIPAAQTGQAVFVARVPGVVAGLPLIDLIAAQVDARLTVTQLHTDGIRVAAGTELASLHGPMRGLLTAERTALNFLQRLSGVATLTRRYVDELVGLSTRLLDTRKTLPGWRLLDKYAVRQGGGHNHRLGLYDGMLIKDNHLAAVAAAGEPHTAIVRAITAARAMFPGLPIEIEVDTLVQLEQALPAQPDIVLLDNLGTDALRTAVARRNAVAPATQLEASGGITLANLRVLAETGVERISIGALTHSAPALDIALDYRT